MGIDVRFYIGILAGIISFLSYLIYFRSILKGETKPNRVTWWIWTFMGGVLAASYYFSGARYTIWAPIVEFIGPFLTAILSIKYGEGGVADKTDIFCFIGGILSIVVWIVTGNATLALVLTLAIDQFALIPTIKKSYLRPEGESFWAWLGTSLGDFINLLAIERLTFAIIIYPIWMLIDDIVKQLLAERDPGAKITLLQPERVTDISEPLRELQPDFFIVAAYAQIIPKSILAIPRLGAIGVHPSLLPKYRGPSPMPSAILAAETMTGVTLYLMDAKMDNGPILSTREIPIGQRTYLELESELAKLGAEMLAQIIPKFLQGEIKPVEQDHSQASFTKKFEAADGFVEFVNLQAALDGDRSQAERISRMIRALNPEPGIWTLKDEQRIKLLRADLQDGRLILQEIQRAGKTPEAVAPGRRLW